MIGRIEVSGFRGMTKSIELSERTFLVGPNGAGKSSVIHAAMMVLNGYLPTSGKRGKDIMDNASDGMIRASMDINGHKIGRGWTATKRGVSETLHFDGRELKAKDSAALDLILDGASIFDPQEFFALSPRQQQIAVLRGLENAEQMLNAEETARKVLNDIRSRRREAEQAVVRISTRLSELPVALDEPGLKDRIKAVKDTIKQLRERISEGQKNDSRRMAIEESCSKLPELDAALKEAVVAKDAAAVAVKTAEEALEQYPVEIPYPHADHFMVSDYVLEIITRLIHEIEDDDYFSEDIVMDLQSILDSRQYVADNKKWASHREELVLNVHKANVLLQKTEDRVDTLRQQIDEISKRKESMSDIGPGLDPQDEVALKASEANLDELHEVEKALIERNTLKDEIERANIEVAKIAEEEDKAKESVSNELLRIGTAISEATNQFTDDASAILPTGRLSILSEESSWVIGWERNGTLIPRSCLSGGERVIFDAALGYALKGPKATVFLDAGEVDDDNIQAVMQHVDSAPIEQIVIARWRDVGEVNEKVWKRILM